MERSNERTTAADAGSSAENLMMGISAEEFYNLPTAEYAHRRAFLFKPLTVYHAAFQACADLKNVEVFFFLIYLYVKLNSYIACIQHSPLMFSLTWNPFFFFFWVIFPGDGNASGDVRA